MKRTCTILEKGLGENMVYHNLTHKIFADIDIEDHFFDTLKSDYPEFCDWYNNHPTRDAYVQIIDNSIKGFLSIKAESRAECDGIEPAIDAERLLKVSTFKIDAHGTKMGEQFIKIITDMAVNEKVEVCYVTIFDKHKPLIELVEMYGFVKHGIKRKTGEGVYVKWFTKLSNDVYKDFPMINIVGKRKYILGIYPKYHSVMFPDSILTNENKNILIDISHTNSIRKVYVCSMQGVDELIKGDVLVIYRTAEDGRSAEYSAVATSICVVDEIRSQAEFNNFEEFYNYVYAYSPLEENDLRYWYNRGGLVAIRMTYNAAFKKRIVRHDLIEKIGLERVGYWGFFSLSDEQFLRIAQEGGVDKLLWKEHTFDNELD